MNVLKAKRNKRARRALRNAGIDRADLPVGTERIRRRWSRQVETGLSFGVVEE